MTTAFVEFSVEGKPVRIFRTEKAAKLSPAWDYALVRECPRAEAVGGIRRQVFERDGWACIKCGKALSWFTGELHEKVHRGNGGEISLDNSEMRCNECHTGGPNSAHGNRLPRFTPRTRL